MNNAKRTAILILSLFIFIVTNAQTQIARVKTRGRMINDTYVPGKGLPGAIVSIDGLTDIGVKKSNGTFGIPVEDESFLVLSIKKQGYTLIDADAVPRAYTYTDDTLYFVMETPEQKEADEFESKRELQRTIYRELQKREEEIEQLRKENRITHEEYQQKIKKIYADIEKSQQLIKEMAEYYAQIDYDKLDDLNRKVNYYIRQGRLQQADSMINNKGDIHSRIKRLKLNREKNRVKRAEYEEQGKNLAVSEKGVEKECKDLAEDCYKKFQIFKLQHLHDSAAHYIELRAGLDTTNTQWLFDAALYMQNQKNFSKAETYYSNVVELYKGFANKKNEAYEPDLANTLNNLGLLYYYTHRFSESEQMYKEALKIYRRVAKRNPEAYESDLAGTLSNLGFLYHLRMHRFSEGEQILKEAMEIQRRLAKRNPETYEPGLAKTLNNLGLLYCNTHRFSESEQMYKEAMEIQRRIAKSNPEANEPDLAITLNNLGNLYYNTQRFSESEQMLKEAMEIRRRLVKSNPEAYDPDLAGTLDGLGLLYCDTHRFSESEQMYKEVMEIRRRLVKSNPEAYEPYLATTLSMLGMLYYNTQRFSECEQMLKEAMEIRRRLVKSNPEAYEPYLETTLNNLGLLYCDTQRFSESEQMYKEAMEIQRRLAKSNPEANEPGLAKILNNLGLLYCNTHRFSEGEQILKEAMEIQRRIAKSNPEANEPDLAITLNNLGNLYYNTQRFSESEQMLKEVMEIRRRLVKRNPETYEPGLAKILNNLGSLYSDTHRFSESEQMYKEAMEIKRKKATAGVQGKTEYAGSLHMLSLLYGATENHIKEYNICKELIPLLQDLYHTSPEQYNELYATTLGNNSFSCIFLQKFTEAEHFAREGLKIDSTKTYIYTNLAASLLLQGEYEEAREIYTKYKNEFKEGLLNDLKEFEAAGIVPEEHRTEVEKIKQLLNEQ